VDGGSVPLRLSAPPLWAGENALFEIFLKISDFANCVISSPSLCAGRAGVGNTNAVSTDDTDFTRIICAYLCYYLRRFVEGVLHEWISHKCG